MGVDPDAGSGKRAPRRMHWHGARSWAQCRRQSLHTMAAYKSKRRSVKTKGMLEASAETCWPAGEVRRTGSSRNATDMTHQTGVYIPRKARKSATSSADENKARSSSDDTPQSSQSQRPGQREAHGFRTPKAPGKTQAMCHIARQWKGIAPFLRHLDAFPVSVS